jgi:hypothetical protein
MWFGNTFWVFSKTEHSNSPLFPFGIYATTLRFGSAKASTQVSASAELLFALHSNRVDAVVIRDPGYTKQVPLLNIVHS